MGRAALDIAKARKKIVSFIRDKAKEARVEGAVIGLSGGIDSAVSAYLAVEALGIGRVTALLMPDSRVTPKVDVTDARSVADRLGIKRKEIDIAPVHRAFMKGLRRDRLAEGNLRARIRMSLLYFHANSSNRMVIGTGDRSEALIGYFTKYGDGGADIFPIGDLYKTEVRRMGELLGVPSGVISKPSSPSLWQGQTAEGELGMGYEVIDRILESVGGKKMGVRESSERLGLKEEVVTRVVGLMDNSEHKRAMPEICVVH